MGNMGSRPLLRPHSLTTLSVLPTCRIAALLRKLRCPFFQQSRGRAFGKKGNRQKLGQKGEAAQHGQEVQRWQIGSFLKN
jgi:hypothetical protein